MFLEPTPESIKKEREKARDLRKSGWWQNKLAAGLCHYCRKETEKKNLTMDHIVPVSRGGKSSKGNVVSACKSCNTAKKDLTAVEWDAYLEDNFQPRLVLSATGLHKPGKKT